MNKKKIYTPYGPMFETGIPRLFLASVIDCVTAILIVFFVIGILERSGFTIFESAKWVPGIFIFIYCYLTYQHKAPSLGNWSLVIQKYPGDKVEGYVGNESVRLVKDLSITALIGRLITAITTIVLLFGACWMVLTQNLGFK